MCSPYLGRSATEGDIGCSERLECNPWALEAWKEDEWAHHIHQQRDEYYRGGENSYLAEEGNVWNKREESTPFLDVGVPTLGKPMGYYPQKGDYEKVYENILSPMARKFFVPLDHERTERKMWEPEMRRASMVDDITWESGRSRQALSNKPDGDSAIIKDVGTERLVVYGNTKEWVEPLHNPQTAEIGVWEEEDEAKMTSGIKEHGKRASEQGEKSHPITGDWKRETLDDVWNGKVGRSRPIQDKYGRRRAAAKCKRESYQPQNDEAYLRSRQKIMGEEMLRSASELEFDRKKETAYQLEHRDEDMNKLLKDFTPRMKTDLDQRPTTGTSVWTDVRPESIFRLE